MLPHYGYVYRNTDGTFVDCVSRTMDQHSDYDTRSGTTVDQCCVRISESVQGIRMEHLLIGYHEQWINIQIMIH